MSTIEKALAAALLELEAAQISSVVDQQEAERERQDFLDQNVVSEQKITIRNERIATQDDLLAALHQQLDQAQNTQTIRELQNEISKNQVRAKQAKAALEQQAKGLKVRWAEALAQKSKAETKLKDVQTQLMATLAAKIEAERQSAAAAQAQAARMAQEERKRRKLEEAERRRLEREAMALQAKANTATDKASASEESRKLLEQQLAVALARIETFEANGSTEDVTVPVDLDSTDFELSVEQRIDLQTTLQKLGFYNGAIDGNIGTSAW